MGRTTDGWGSGLVGVVIFSGSLPATRVAVGGLHAAVPDFGPRGRRGPARGRAARRAAAETAGPRRPRRRWPSWALGVVVGLPAADGAGAAATSRRRGRSCSSACCRSRRRSSACCAAGERPRPAFWLFSVAGCLPPWRASRSCGAAARRRAGDLLMVAAVLLCGLGYAEGATLSRRLGGWQVISWALVLGVAGDGGRGALRTLPGSWSGIGLPAWAGLAYVSVFSMLVGFVFWYRGLALGGIAGVGSAATAAALPRADRSPASCCSGNPWRRAWWR